MIDLGPIKINKAFFGNNRVKKAYLGETLVYEDNGGNAEDYVQNGLVLHLDAKLPGNTSGQWKDLKAGVVFTNYGAIFNKDHVYFNGVSSYLTNTTFSAPTSDKGTIEVVIDDETFGTKLSLTFMSKTKGGLGFGKNASRHTLWSCGSASRAKPVATLAKASFSISNVRKYQNGVSMSTSGSDYWGNQNTTTWIGRRNTGNYFTKLQLIPNMINGVPGLQLFIRFYIIR